MCVCLYVSALASANNNHTVDSAGCLDSCNALEPRPALRSCAAAPSLDDVTHCLFCPAYKLKIYVNILDMSTEVEGQGHKVAQCTLRREIGP